MSLSANGQFFEKHLASSSAAAEDHRFKFVLNGQWVLQEGRPSTADENGNLNHQIHLESAAQHDHGLNPAARAFSPTFNSNASTQAETYPITKSRRSRSRSKARSHSRNSSVSSHHRSLSRHDELNPAAHEFKPQFQQPTHQVPHVSGYAAAAKKAPSPPIPEFKKPQLPKKKEASVNGTKKENKVPQRTDEETIDNSSEPVSKKHSEANNVKSDNHVMRTEVDPENPSRGRSSAQSEVKEVAIDVIDDVKKALPEVSEQASKAKETIVDAVENVTDTAKEVVAEATEVANQPPNEHANESSTEPASTGAEDQVGELNLDTIVLSADDYDVEQIRLMEEVCILLDRDDKPIGSASKKDAHLMSNINDGLLHRAFSLFIFNEEGKLLLQQRATEKITFPDMWTNTCCSHPLSIPGEVADDLPGSVLGVKRAAQRKVEQELGIKAADAPIDRMNFLTRIHYLAASDGKWGEHEIDYILFLRSDPQLKVNPNEVRDCKWVSQADLRTMFETTDLSYTPWFKLICETFLFKWWDNLAKLDSCKDEQTIHRLGLAPELFEKIQHTKQPSSDAESVSGDAEPAAEGQSLPLDFKSGTPAFENKSGQADTKPEPLVQQRSIDPESEPAAESAAAEFPTTAEVSRPSTGKKSIKANSNFFAFVFNALFGGIFRGCKFATFDHSNLLVSSIWAKLAIWRKSPDEPSH